MREIVSSPKLQELGAPAPTEPVYEKCVDRVCENVDRSPEAKALSPPAGEGVPQTGHVDAGLRIAIAGTIIVDRDILSLDFPRRT